MARYDNLVSTLQSNVYTNTDSYITGNRLQTVLNAFVNTLGKNSGFMGVLSESNKPTTTPDGKQFYIGYNTSTTAIGIDLSDIGLGILSIARDQIYLVYCDDNGWHSVDIMAGVSAAVPTSVAQLSDAADYATFPDTSKTDSSLSISKLDANKVYWCDSCSSLIVSNYNYDSSDAESMALLPTYIVLPAVAESFVVEPPARYMLRDGDSLTLDADSSYIITIHGMFWKIEKYA